MNIDLTGLNKAQQIQKLDCHIAALTAQVAVKQNELAELNKIIIDCINKKRSIECGGLVL